ncbi:MAG: tRNA (cytidine(34)-2'-O)-methyltransferase [Alphaproteobacteria bacterium]|nr:tRNA (cytidine(34)-2'-O)-methyltransferase [Alphaproteobacteria bacterium]
MRLALYQPEIPQNTGTLMRLCACLDLPLDIIHPCGFVWNDRHLRRAGMDYKDKATVHHHENWQAFFTWSQKEKNRIVLLDTKSSTPYTRFSFQAQDIILMGQESSGVPDEVFHALPQRLMIPMAPECRSLNISLAAAMVVGEGIRQLDLFPK